MIISVKKLIQAIMTKRANGQPDGLNRDVKALAAYGPELNRFRT